jgi:hypothetical protein
MSHKSYEKEAVIDSDLDFFKQENKKQKTKIESNTNILYLVRGIIFLFFAFLFILVVDESVNKIDRPYGVHIASPEPFPMDNDKRVVEFTDVDSVIRTPSDQADLLTKNNIDTSKMTAEQMEALTKMVTGLESITNELSKSN